MASTLVLLRHGQSTWNLRNLFTGWYDADLSPRGVQEAVNAGRLMSDAGVRPAVLHTSLLVRAIRTANLALDEMDLLWLPVRRTWRLNERHYGALSGLDKKETAERHGTEQVNLWRRSYDIAPPPVERTSPYHPANDPRYAGLPPEVLPASECLADVLARMLPWWQDDCVPDLRAGHTVLVAAHGNSLRALVMHLDGLSPDAVLSLNIPTGIPLVYRLDDALRPVSARYLDPEAAAVGALAVAAQAG